MLEYKYKSGVHGRWASSSAGFIGTIEESKLVQIPVIISLRKVPDAVEAGDIH